MGDLAVDLGTTNLRVWRSDGELLREPAVVTAQRARRRWRRSARLVGHEALEMAERTGGEMKLVRPLREGTISDVQAAQTLLRAAFAAGRSPLTLKGPSALFTVPPLFPEMQQRALRRLAFDAGARSVSLVPSSLAVLAGLGIDVSAPAGHMVVDVGGGTTQMAIVALSSIIVSRSIAVGGDHMDQAIDDYLQRRFNLRTREGVAEELRVRLGAAHRDVQVEPVQVEGQDVITGQVRIVDVHCAEIFGVLAPLLEELLELARAVLAVTPPELAADVADDGIVLSGGASQLRELESVLGTATGVSVVRVEDPLGAAARGCARFLGASAKFGDSLVQS